jgi:hypothetical protein
VEPFEVAFRHGRGAKVARIGGDLRIVVLAQLPGGYDNYDQHEWREVGTARWNVDSRSVEESDMDASLTEAVRRAIAGAAPAAAGR